MGNTARRLWFWAWTSLLLYQDIAKRYPTSISGKLPGVPVFRMMPACRRIRKLGRRMPLAGAKARLGAPTNVPASTDTSDVIQRPN